jgi:hypothetical protein
LLSATFAHDEQGLRSLCRQLVRLKVRLVAVVEFPRFARHLGLWVNSKYIMSFERVSLNYPA